MIRLTAVFVAVFAVATVVSAHEMPKPYKGSPEFEMMKNLKGKWKGSTKDEHGMSKAVTAEFKVTSMGSAVEETLGKGTPDEMVDMYVDEGGKLTMKHYCAIGNQPHLVLKNGDAKQIELEMDQTPGIDAAKDAHMHGLTIEFTDPNHIVERWSSYENGKAGQPTVFKLARTR